MDEASLFAGVCECIRQTLGKELPGMRGSDRLIADLGADSLDFLDLVFRLEQKFNVNVNPRALERRAQENLGGALMVVDGCYTAQAVEELRKAMPEVPEAELYPGMPMNALPASFRVSTFVNLVADALRSTGGAQ